MSTIHSIRPGAVGDLGHLVCVAPGVFQATDAGRHHLALDATARADARPRRAMIGPAIPIPSPAPPPRPRSLPDEVRARVTTLRAQRTDLDEAAALAQVFAADPALYTRYRDAAPTVGATVAPRADSEAPARSRHAIADLPVPHPPSLEAEIQQRVVARRQAQPALDDAAALGEVFAADPALYRRYRDAAPTAGATVRTARSTA
ncbi:MAG: hypothetical protein KJ066_16240 [Acidobacteria bacterium]|nr:hypothetical protein [Acidobacteriota bacterium]